MATRRTSQATRAATPRRPRKPATRRAKPTKLTKPAVQKRTYFKIPIGNWRQGVGADCVYVIASALGTMTQIRQAYLTGTVTVPEHLHPARLFNSGTRTTAQVFEEMGQRSGIDFDETYFKAIELGRYVVWYLNHCAPELCAEAAEDASTSLMPEDEFAGHWSADDLSPSNPHRYANIGEGVF